MKQGYDLQQFHPEYTRQTRETLNPEPDQITRQWCQAVAAGFNEPPLSGEQVNRKVKTFTEGKGTLTAIYPEQPSPDPSFADHPVGTFARFKGQVNVGGGTLTDACLLTDVTVQANHKRRGLLSEMMTRNLHQAADDGAAVALLTATSGSLYGRYGFFPIVNYTAARVMSTPRFTLPDETMKRLANNGRIEPVSLAWLVANSEEVYDRYLHCNRGATTRYASYFQDAYYLDHADHPNPKYRSVAYLSDEGTLNGYAIYSVHNESIIEVAEVVAANLDADCALWQHLTGIELVKAVHYSKFSTPVPVTPVLKDPRAVRVTGIRDALWARVLDPARLLRERHYSLSVRTAGFQTVIRVDDPTGIAEGTFRVSLSPLWTEVTPTDEAPHLSVTVRGLTALAFGACPIQPLLDSGEITLPDSPASTQRASLASEMFRPDGPSGFLSEF